MNVPIAYKFVVVTLMIAKVNFYAERLHLPMRLPINEEMLERVTIFPSPRTGFMARLDAEGYSFCFSKLGRLRFVTNIRGGQEGHSLQEYQETLSHEKCVLTQWDAYRLATNWLVLMDVDLQRLEQDYVCDAKQEVGVSWSTPAKAMRLPIFDVIWGVAKHPIIDIKISGVTGDLLELREEQDLYSKVPAGLIKNPKRLLAISDAEFVTYSKEERRNLIARFASPENSLSSNCPVRSKPAEAVPIQRK